MESEQLSIDGRPLDQFRTFKNFSLGLIVASPDRQWATPGSFFAFFHWLKDVLHLFGLANCAVVQQLGEVVLKLSHAVYDPWVVFVGPVPEANRAADGELRQLVFFVRFFHLFMQLFECAVSEVEFVGEGKGSVENWGLVDDVVVFFVVVVNGDDVALAIV